MDATSNSRLTDLRLQFNVFKHKFQDLFKPETSESSTNKEKSANCCICQFRNVQKPATHQCLDCSDTLCAECQNGHRASRATYTHKVVPMQEVPKGAYCLKVMNSPLLRCDEHKDEAFKLFCESCSKLICALCFIMWHKDHTISTIKDAVYSHQEHVQQSRLKLKEKVNEEVRKLQEQNLEERMKRVKDSQDRLLTEIQSRSEYLIKFIQEEERTATSKVVDFYDAQLQSFKSLKEQTRTSNELANQLLLFFEDIQTDDDFVRFLMLYKDTKSVLDTFNAYESQLNIEPTRPFGDLYLEDPVKSLPKLFNINEKEPPISEVKIQVASCDTKSEADSKSSPHCEQLLADSPATLEEDTTECVNLTSSLSIVGSAVQTLDKNVEIDNPNVPVSSETESSNENVSHGNLSLKLKSKLDIGVSRDLANPEIKGLCITKDTKLKIVISDWANKKIRLVNDSGRPLNMFHLQNSLHLPFNSVITVGDLIVFLCGTMACLVNSFLQPVRYFNIDKKETSAAFLPLCKFNDKSFIVGGLSDNKTRIYNTSGSIVSEQTAPVKGPIVAISQDGSDQYLYSSWHQPGAVHLVKKTGQLVRTFRPYGLSLWYPEGTCVDNINNVYIADPRQDRIHVFQDDGSQLLAYSTLRDVLFNPRCIVISSDRYLYVSGFNSQVFKYKVEGDYVKQCQVPLEY